MRNFKVLFAAKDLKVQLRAVKTLPQDKASAFLTKLQESSASTREFLANYQPNTIEWQMKDISWLN